jgi:hypothetical protein
MEKTYERWHCDCTVFQQPIRDVAVSSYSLNALQIRSNWHYYRTLTIKYRPYSFTKNLPLWRETILGAEKMLLTQCTVPISWPHNAVFCWSDTHVGWKYKIAVAGSSSSFCNNWESYTRIIIISLRRTWRFDRSKFKNYLLCHRGRVFFHATLRKSIIMMFLNNDLTSLSENKQTLTVEIN